jgi:hypothetical protein
MAQSRYKADAHLSDKLVIYPVGQTLGWKRVSRNGKIVSGGMQDFGPEAGYSGRYVVATWAQRYQARDAALRANPDIDQEYREGKFDRVVYHDAAGNVIATPTE